MLLGTRECQETDLDPYSLSVFPSCLDISLYIAQHQQCSEEQRNTYRVFVLTSVGIMDGGVMAFLRLGFAKITAPGFGIIGMTSLPSKLRQVFHSDD